MTPLRTKQLGDKNYLPLTSMEMYKAIRGLQNKGMKKLILDLRSNGGGLLYQAIEVADMFLLI